MGYYINFEELSLDKYRQILKSTPLIPSWKILADDIDKNLDVIKTHNVQNIAQLLTVLKDKNRIHEFSKKSGLSEDYLTVLNRVLKGYRHKPNRIEDFACLSEDTVIKLLAAGLKNTSHVYDEILISKKRNELSAKTGINKGEILRLTKLTDLSRIRWVNHTFACVLLEAGYDTTEKVAESNSQELYEMVKQLNDDRKIFKAHIGLRDMKLVIESAKMLDLEVKY